MTKHDGRRAARPLVTGVMGPTTTTTRRITIPMKVGPSIPFAGFASAIEVREKSPFEKYIPAQCQNRTHPGRAPCPPCRAFGLNRLETHLRPLGHGGPWPAIAEADTFVAQLRDLKLPDGRDRVVRHGHGPQRAIQTGIGMGASGGTRSTAGAATRMAAGGVYGGSKAGG
jgi:hypothetical protein